MNQISSVQIFTIAYGIVLLAVIGAAIYYNYLFNLNCKIITSDPVDRDTCQRYYSKYVLFGVISFVLVLVGLFVTGGLSR